MQYMCNRDTEEYALYDEHVNMERYKLIDAGKQDIIEKMNQCLRDNDDTFKQQLYSMFFDDKFNELYMDEREIAYMRVAAEIYMQEKSNDEKDTIFDRADNVNDVIALLKEIKFFLRRIEFADDTDAIGRICIFCGSGILTPPFLKVMFETCILNKQRTALYLVDAFRKKGMLRFSYYMLCYLNEVMTGDERILCMLAEFMGEMGRMDEVEKYIGQITLPSTLTEGIRKKYGL